MKRIFALTIVLIFWTCTAYTQLRINEISNNNQNTLQDEYGEYPDWLEIYNYSASAINLSNYFLSDKSSVPLQFQLPNYNLPAGGRILVMSSGRNINRFVDHWETAINYDDTWTYLVPSTEPDTNWVYPTFIPSGWNTGQGGIGYGDGDDNTTISNCNSVYLRKTFNVTNPNALVFGLMSIDYDDGFVAYLNGVEIARSNIGGASARPAFNEPAVNTHEAAIYTGGGPEFFVVDPATLSSALLTGTNVLCIQVHNTDIASSDLSSIVWLHFGIADNATYFGANPPWFTLGQTYLHTNFSISASGEKIYLNDNNANLIDFVSVPALDMDHSYGSLTDGDTTRCYFNVPTPNSINSGSLCYSGYAEAPQILPPAGHYPGSTMISIVGNGNIHFTWDGDVPETIDPQYTASFLLPNTAVIRARTIPSSGNLLPSRIATSTFLINENIDLPIFSLATDSVNLWDYNYGIYVFGPNADSINYPYFGSNFWQNWERPVHIEYFAKDDQLKFAYDGGLKIHGGWSRGNDQKSLRLLSKNKYSDGKLSYPLLSDKPWIEEFTNVNLRNGGNDYWEARSRDAFMQRLVRHTHVDYMGYEPAICFLNGMYWGEYEIREREDQYFIENNHGIAADHVDILAHTYNGINIINGSDQGYYNMLSVAYNLNVTDTAYFEDMKPYLDWENFADYFITQSYVGNGDFMSGYPNNIKMWKPADQPGPWRHVLWDIDFGLGLYDGDYNRNYLNEMRTSGIYSGALLDHTLQNPVFRHYFINRYADIINTSFHPDSLTPEANSIIDSLLGDLPRHHNQWGGSLGGLYNVYQNMYDYNSLRRQGARDLIQADFGMSGQVDVTIQVQPAGAGYIKISTIIPPTLPWTGLYFNGNPVRIIAVANPGYTFDHWNANSVMGQTSSSSIFLNIFNDAVFTAVFTGNAQSADVVISEINFNSDSSRNSGDWIELYNRGSVAVELTGYSIRKATPYQTFRLPDGLSIAPGSYLVLAEDSLAFATQHPSISNVREIKLQLENSGDEIHLLNAKNQSIQSVTFSDEIPWVYGADGTGRTMEFRTDSTNQNDPQNWFAGCMFGSPGMAFSACQDALIFSEINYHPLSPMGDWVEIRNMTGSSIDLSNWYISDANSDNRFYFPSGTIIAPDQSIVIAENDTLFHEVWPGRETVIGSTSFGFSNAGEMIRLFNASGILEFSIFYEDTLWPTEADGFGKTLELRDPTKLMQDHQNWFAGCYNGSPAKAYDPECWISDPEGDLNWWISYDASSDQIIIEAPLTRGNLDLDIYDINGKLLLQHTLGGTGHYRIPASKLSSGVYLVKLGRTGEKGEAKKLAVTKV
jgi:hypothetical protein